MDNQSLETCFAGTVLRTQLRTVSAFEESHSDPLVHRLLVKLPPGINFDELPTTDSLPSSFDKPE